MKDAKILIDALEKIKTECELGMIITSGKYIEAVATKALASYNQTDKDKEIEKIGNESMIFEIDLRNAKIEIERLKVLVVIAHSEGYEDAVHHIEYKKSWQQFQKENNL